ncbi:hypothetical protein HHK36_020065 [Tetracentron sinense]|uniref:Uncharacterized protein n=1 Tax=Tetracentron sinense TaxID=13715 RepID=A0A834YSY8_TETSI|nr:hypothetical protein HHK36_020065 [Tetracentron sinense]
MAGGRGKSGKKRKKKLENRQHLSPLISLIASATTAAHSFLTQNDLHLHPSQTLTLESKISSIALSLTKLHSLLQTLNPTKSLKTLTPPPLPLSSSPSPCWFQRFLSAASDDSDPRWIESFRMSKRSFKLLLQTLTPSLPNSLSYFPPVYRLGAALFRLAHAASFKSVGRRFGVDSRAACRAFYEVCKAVNDRLGHLFEFPSDLRRIVEGFGWLSLPNCCGVLGFCRFPIDGGGLGKDGAVIVQGLVDSEGRFLDISAGWPSSLKPDMILRQTKLFLRVVESKELLNGPSFKLGDGNLVPQYILGDSCCPLLRWLLTPFPGSCEDKCFNSVARAFNSGHCRGMGLVSKAFGRVRARWQLLSMRWKEECIEFFPFVIVTGCLLHNFLIKCSDMMPEEEYLAEQRLPTFEGKGNESGERLRNLLGLHLSKVWGRSPVNLILQFDEETEFHKISVSLGLPRLSLRIGRLLLQSLGSGILPTLSGQGFLTEGDISKCLEEMSEWILDKIADFGIFGVFHMRVMRGSVSFILFFGISEGLNSHLWGIPPQVLVLYITGGLNAVLSPEHQKEIKRYIYNHQNEDGGWGLHVEGQSTMFGSALSYIALRLLGEKTEDGEDMAVARGRKWILDHGGATAIPS